jgi:hypothetical protein
MSRSSTISAKGRKLKNNSKNIIKLEKMLRNYKTSNKVYELSCTVHNWCPSLYNILLSIDISIITFLYFFLI